MSGKLRAVRARFINVFNFDEFEFDLGKFTLIRGANGKGKTASLNAIRSLWEGQSHDVTLLKQGAKRGEISLVLSDGVEIAKEILEGKTFLTVRVPKLGHISRAPGYVKGLIGLLSLNPIEFLTAKPEQQKELFLSALPLTVTREQLAEAVGFPLTIPVEGHALDVIAAAESMFYKDRTDVNRSLKSKQAAVEQIAESLPRAPEQGDWPGAVKEAERTVSLLEAELTGRTHTITSGLAVALANLNHASADAVAKLRAEAQERVSQIQLQLTQDVAAAEGTTAEQRDARRRQEREELEALEAEVAPKLEEARQSRTHARTMAEQHTKAESARQLLAHMQQEAKALAEESAGLTQGLEGLRALRASLTAQLPIPGAEIHDGELYLDGIPLARVAESRLISLAVELAMLGAGELGLILVDGLEALDSHTLELFKATVAKYEDAQVLGTCVEDPDPTRPETLGLTVEREG